MKHGFMNTDMLRSYTESCEDLADEMMESWTRAPEGIPLFTNFSDMIDTFSVVIFFGKAFYREHGAKAMELVKEFAKISRDPLLQLLPHSLWHLLPSGKRGFAIQRQLDELIIENVARDHYEQKKHGLPVDQSTYFGFLCQKIGRAHV